MKPILFSSRWPWVLLLALLAAGFIVTWIAVSRPRYLPDKAVRYPLPATLKLGAQTRGHLQYSWLSNLTVFLPREITNDNYEFVQLDLVTGNTTPIETIERLADGVALTNGFTTWDLSPDGRHLLLVNFALPNSTLIAGRLDGSERRTWQMRLDDVDFVWMPANTGLLTLVDNESNCLARIVRFGSGAVEQVLVTNGTNHEALGFTKAGTVLTMKGSQRWAALPLHDIELGELNLDSRVVSVREFKVRLPQAAELVTAELSPNGDRLAWSLFRTRKTFQLFKTKRFPYLRPRQVVQETVWISEADGRRMRRVGDLPPTVIAEVSWTPDGKHLEFLWQNTIHLVPVK